MAEQPVRFNADKTSCLLNIIANQEPSKRYYNAPYGSRQQYGTDLVALLEDSAQFTEVKGKVKVKLLAEKMHKYKLLWDIIQSQQVTVQLSCTN